MSTDHGYQKRSRDMGDVVNIIRRHECHNSSQNLCISGLYESWGWVAIETSTGSACCKFERQAWSTINAVYAGNYISEFRVPS